MSDKHVNKQPLQPHSADRARGCNCSCSVEYAFKTALMSRTSFLIMLHMELRCTTIYGCPTPEIKTAFRLDHFAADKADPCAGFSRPSFGRPPATSRVRALPPTRTWHVSQACPA